MVIVGFDLETTDKTPHDAMPVQICAVAGNDEGNQTALVNTLCNPGVAIAPGATEVHGITNEMVSGKMPASVVLNQMVSGMQGAGAELIVTYNGSMFDIPITERILGETLLPGVARLDLLDVAYRFMPKLTRRKLTDLYLYAFGKELSGAHDASVDVYATIELADWFCNWIELQPLELAKEMTVVRPYSIMPIGKHAGKALVDIPIGWANWMKINARDMRPDLAATVNAVLGR